MAQPAVHGLTADAVALGDLDHLEPVRRTSMTALKRCSTTVSSRSTLPTSSPRPGGRSRRRTGGGVNQQPEHQNPSAGINRSSIYRGSTANQTEPLPEICQKLRYAQPHVAPPPNPRQRCSPARLCGHVRRPTPLRTTRASMVRMGSPVGVCLLSIHRRTLTIAAASTWSATSSGSR
jgi:hypothetical protein